MTQETYKYLLIGALSPHTDPAASTAAALAHLLAGYGDVTCVIDDHTMMPSAPDNIMLIRAQTLRAQQETYMQHKRLFCLGNSSESLFVYDLMQEMTGTVIVPNGSLYDLILAQFQTNSVWPHNYTSWLTDILSENGKTIAEGLARHRRLSRAINTEIHDKTPLNFEGHTVLEISKDKLFPFISEAPSNDDNNNTSGIVCVGLQDETKTMLAASWESLAIDVPIQFLSSGDMSIHAHIQNADVVVLGDATTNPPPALSVALQSGTPVITMGQPWRGLLPPDAHMNVVGPNAVHQLVAAIGAVVTNPNLRESLLVHAANFWQQHKPTDQVAALMAYLHKQDPLKLRTKASAYSAKTTAARTPVPNSYFTAGEQAAIALIGSVPSASLVTKLLPGIDWQHSPRFATPELVQALNQHKPEDPLTLLARLGFEAPIIKSNAARDLAPELAGSIQSWHSVRRHLRSAKDAITFNCDVTDIPAINQIDAALLKGRYGLTIDFSMSIRPGHVPTFDRVEGYMNDSGLFWELDRPRNIVRCILIAGIAGKYRLTNMSPSTHQTHIVADGTASQMLDHKPIMLTSDAHGIIAFVLRAFDSSCDRPLDNEGLLKSLAQTPFKLEWFSHD